MIRVICSKCGIPANLPDSTAGKVAVCKCGQKNPIPQPPQSGTPAGAHRAPAAPPVARPAAPKPPAYSHGGPVGKHLDVPDDLALQDLDHLTGARKENAPVPCPACAEPLPVGEIVCRHCGYVADENAMGKDKRIINKPRPASWGGKHASELTAMDFVRVAWSPQVFSAMIMLVLRTVFATFLMLFIAVGFFLGGGFILGLLVSVLPPWAGILVIAGVWIVLVALIYGVVVKEAFAVCEAACFGYDAPRVESWPPLRAGFLFLLLFFLPGLSYVLASFSSGPIAGVVVYYVVAVFIVPMTFLSVSQSGGDWSGLNPVRIFTWVGRLFVPYLGVAGILLVETIIIFGLAFLGVALLGLANAVQPGGVANYTALGIGAGVLLVTMIMLLHPLVYTAAMLGMLYRKYERKLVG